MTSVPKILAENPIMSPSPQQRPGRGRALCPPVPPRQTVWATFWPPCLHPARPREGPRRKQCQGTHRRCPAHLSGPSGRKAQETGLSGPSAHPQVPSARHLPPLCTRQVLVPSRAGVWPSPRLNKKPGERLHSAAVSSGGFVFVALRPLPRCPQLLCHSVPSAFLWGPGWSHSGGRTRSSSRHAQEGWLREDEGGRSFAPAGPSPRRVLREGDAEGSGLIGPHLLSHRHNCCSQKGREQPAGQAQGGAPGLKRICQRTRPL